MPTGVDQVEPTIFNETDIPAEINWVTAGAVNPVKNLGQCGASCAFSAVSAMESAHFIYSKDLLSLSEQ